MNTTHTPGPWTVCRPICTTHATPIRVHGENLCWVCGLDSALQFSREQTAANARLIAAAPELLAVLKKAGIALRQYQAILESQTAPEKMRPGLPYSSKYPYGIDVEKEIAQAIAQAEGIPT